MIVSPAGLAIVCAITWFAVFLIAHVVGWRAGAGNARWMLATYVFSLGGCLASASVGQLTISSGGNIVLVLAIAALMHACFFVLYAPAVYVVLTSLSVQTIVLLIRYGGTLREDELYARFAGRDIVKGRLETLLSSGYIFEERGVYSVCSRGRFIANSFARVKRLWKLGSGG